MEEIEVALDIFVSVDFGGADDSFQLEFPDFFPEEVGPFPLGYYDSIAPWGQFCRDLLDECLLCHGIILKKGTGKPRSGLYTHAKNSQVPFP